MAVECTESTKHWAEPYTLTLEEVLERMKTGKGTRIFTAHESGLVNVLFADGLVYGLPSNMPISLWRKLLMGEVKSRDELWNWEPSADDPAPINIGTTPPPPPPGEWRLALSILVWLFSVALLLYRAWHSGKIAIARDLPANSNCSES